VSTQIEKAICLEKRTGVIKGDSLGYDPDLDFYVTADGFS
jgi:hypothetical protein